MLQNTKTQDHDEESVSLGLSRQLRLRPNEAEPPAANFAQTVKLQQRCVQTDTKTNVAPKDGKSCLVLTQKARTLTSSCFSSSSGMQLYIEHAS